MSRNVSEKFLAATFTDNWLLADDRKPQDPHKRQLVDGLEQIGNALLALAAVRLNAPFGTSYVDVDTYVAENDSHFPTPTIPRQARTRFIFHNLVVPGAI
jgi:hypothetical protein